MAALVEVAREISATLDPTAVLERVVERARELIGVDTSAVYLAEPDGQSFRAIVALGPIAEAIRSTTRSCSARGSSAARPPIDARRSSTT